MANYMRGESHWNGHLHLRDMMVFFSCGKTVFKIAANGREDGKIIREDVNGSQTTIVDESNVFYVPTLERSLLMKAQ